MKQTYHRNGRSKWSFFHLLVLMLCIGQVVDVLAQPPQKKAGPRKSGVSYSVPYGYNQVGSTKLYYRQSYSIDVWGEFNGNYYSSTYGDYGYYVAMKVGDYVDYVDCENGSEMNGVLFNARVEEQEDLARISYILTNTNGEDVNISLGVHADVQIGYNDYAPITRRIDTFGQTYGLTMMDGNGAQLCVLFGSGLAGVTSVSDYWFGSYWTNSDAYQTVGDYSPDSHWMQEGGGYDSGMGWCWKDRVITAGSTAVFSYLIGVGEVTLEPNSSFDVTPDDPDGWNDLSRPHRLNIEGSYESPAGLSGVIDYAVEDSEEWIALTDTLDSGDDFISSLVAMFDASKSIHRIRFRTRDLVGNTTMLQPIEYVDVRFHSLSGIEDMVYIGDSLYQTHLTSDLEDGKWTTAHYYNNVNVGVATFNLEGVFPYTIGRKPYSFNITPAPLQGNITIVDDNIEFTGERQYPQWQFTNEAFNGLEEGKDYQAYWENNFLPGTATLTIEGIHNYEGTLSTSFIINKAQLTENQYIVNIPDYEINYDGESHGVDVSVSEYVGEPTVTYVSQDGTYNSTVKPIEGGDYDVYLEIAEGVGYYGMENTKVGTFTIYKISATEWAALQTINEKLGEDGNTPWDLSEGIKIVHTLEGVTIEHGNIISINLSNKGLKGQFPAEVLPLANLETLDLSHNNLYGDITSSLITYSEENPDLASHLKYIYVNDNQLMGNIGKFANFFADLERLDASYNCLSEVSPMISSNVTSLSLRGQKIPSAIELGVADFVSSSLREKLPTVLTYNHGSQAYDKDFSFLLVDVAPDAYDGNTWGLSISCIGDENILDNYSGMIEYKGQNGNVVHAIDYGAYSNVNGCTFDIKLTFDMGDVNFSGDVNVLDLQAMINYIFKEYWDMFNYTAANLWTDQIINVQDVIGMVNTLIEKGLPTNAKGQRQVKETNENIGIEASVLCEDGKLIINTLTPVASFDIFVNGCNGIELMQSLESMGMTCVAQRYSEGIHVIGYSLNGAMLPIGETTLGLIAGSTPTVVHAMLSDKSAKEIPSVLNQVVTEINSVNADLAIVANGSHIMLNTAKAYVSLSWSVFDMSGSLIDEGTMTNVSSGNYTLCKRTNLVGHTWIVKVRTDNDKEIVKKINIK